MPPYGDETTQGLIGLSVMGLSFLLQATLIESLL